jgi:hypothetical protein
MWGEQLATVQQKKGMHCTANDEMQHQHGTASCVMCEQFLDGVAHLEACRGALFPPSDGTAFKIDEPLLEDMVEVEVVCCKASMHAGLRTA